MDGQYLYWIDQSNICKVPLIGGAACSDQPVIQMVQDVPEAPVMAPGVFYSMTLLRPLS
jgi:hypothetical protein